MKIPSLLAQYLYHYKQLDLSGIGSFTLDNSAISSLQNSKQRQAILEGVTFVSNPAVKDSSELIGFIAEKTGKMKALAHSDLESHLQLAQQFLNMGKPYLFEGIGILSKVKPGEYEFTSIAVQTDKVKQLNTPEETQAVTVEESSSKYETFLSKPKAKTNWQKPVAVLAVIAGIGVTVWGGYVISKKNLKPQETSVADTTNQVVAVHQDTTAIVPPVADSVSPIKQEPVQANGYKYVLEVAKSKRAFKRYHQLLDNRWNVQLETKDSVQYTLFMRLPVSDTSKTLDSLTAMTGRKVYIEYSN